MIDEINAQQSCSFFVASVLRANLSENCILRHYSKRDYILRDSKQKIYFKTLG